MTEDFNMYMLQDDWMKYLMRYIIKEFENDMKDSFDSY